MNTPSHGSEHPSKAARVLPARPSLEHLKNEARQRFTALRATTPGVQLADAQFQLAREYGFSSWRALKLAVEEGAAPETIDVAGDWIGRFSASTALALHVIRTEGGRWRATLDVPSQGYYGDPIDALTLEGGQMRFTITVRGVNVLYEAGWDADGARWTGTWTQTGLKTPLDLVRGRLEPAPVVEGLNGLWDGRLEAKGGVSLTFRIITDERGTLASLESSTQDGRWFPALSLTREAERVTILMHTVEVVGALSEDLQRIQGTWARDGKTAPLTLIRRKPGAAPPRGPTPAMIEMTPARLAVFAGTYAYASGAKMTLALEGGQLRILTSDGRAAFELVPSGPHDFFCREVDADVVFEVDEDGRSNALIMRFKDRDTHLNRVD